MEKISKKKKLVPNYSLALKRVQRILEYNNYKDRKTPK